MKIVNKKVTVKKKYILEVKVNTHVSTINNSLNISFHSPGTDDLASPKEYVIVSVQLQVRSISIAENDYR